MNPTAFTILGLDIRWYGILIGLGALLGAIIVKYNCKWRELNVETVLDIVLISLFFGIVGARMYYVIFQLKTYSSVEDMLNIRQGGLAVHGGIILGGIAVLVLTKFKKIAFLKVTDVMAPSLILAQAIGRWGNFFNQEAHGGVVSKAFIKHFPNFIQKGMYINGTYYHPTFLYESMWDLIIFIILMITLRKNSRPGIVFFLYLGLYSLGRFFIEGLRTDSLMLGPIRVAQLVSLIGLGICIIYLTVIYKRKNIE